jgi:hypothetical protein
MMLNRRLLGGCQVVTITYREQPFPNKTLPTRKQMAAVFGSLLFRTAPDRCNVVGDAASAACHPSASLTYHLEARKKMLSRPASARLGGIHWNDGFVAPLLNRSRVGCSDEGLKRTGDGYGNGLEKKFFACFAGIAGHGLKNRLRNSNTFRLRRSAL